MCHAVLAAASKVTRAPDIRAGAVAGKGVSTRTEPVKLSADPSRGGCEPLRVILMGSGFTDVWLCAADASTPNKIAIVGKILILVPALLHLYSPLIALDGVQLRIYIAITTNASGVEHAHSRNRLEALVSLRRSQRVPAAADAEQAHTRDIDTWIAGKKSAIPWMSSMRCDGLSTLRGLPPLAP